MRGFFLINGMKILAIIPARGGSKGVPRKNIRHLAGKPLIAWTIEEAKKSKYIDRLILSSEDKEIIDVARSYNCETPFIRPNRLAKDNTTSSDVILHAISEIENYDLVVMLQPTSPFRAAKDIDLSIEQLVEKRAPSCVSLTETRTSPYWMYTVEVTGKIQQLIQQKELITRRQDLPIVYALNGAIYIAQIDWFKRVKSFLTKETVGYLMPRNRSYDIDTEEDFLFCEWILDRMK